MLLFGERRLTTKSNYNTPYTGQSLRNVFYFLNPQIDQLSICFLRMLAMSSIRGHKLVTRGSTQDQRQGLEPAQHLQTVLKIDPNL